EPGLWRLAAGSRAGVPYCNASGCAVRVLLTLASSRRVPNCGSEHIYRITRSIQATGISCVEARQVFRAVEAASLPDDVASTPYFHYSRTHSVRTTVGTSGVVANRTALRVVSTTSSVSKATHTSTGTPFTIDSSRTRR